MPDFAVTTAFRATDKMSPVFNRMGGASERFGHRATGSFRRASRGAFGLMSVLKRFGPLVGGAAIFRFAQRSSELFNQQEAAVANVNAGLKSTNNQLGLTSKELQSMAAGIQNNGIFGDEKILQSVTAQLLTFGNIGKTNFNRVSIAVADVTAKLKGINATQEDLRATSIMLGKAMDDPARGMSALRRVGISFSNAEAKLVKNMQAANNTVGAQNLMLKLIERQYGGTNKALAETNAGLEIAAKNKMGDTMEKIGAQMVPLKKVLFDFALFILPKINTAIPVLVGFLKDIAPVAIAAAGAFVLYKAALVAVAFWQAAVSAVGMIRYFSQMLPIMRASIKAQGLYNFLLKGTSLWSGILAVKTGLVTAATWLWNAALSANPIGLIIIGVGALIYRIYQLIDQWEAFKKSFTEGGIVGLAAKIIGIPTPEELQKNQQTTAPNASEVASRNQNTTVNINNKNVETEADVTPRQGAQINYAAMGAN